MKTKNKILTLLVLILVMCVCCSGTVLAAKKKTPISETDGEKIVTEAKKWIGVPYKYGGESKKGVDCSGLVYAVYNNAGFSVNRIGALSYLTDSNFKEVNKNELQKGDLIIYKNPGHIGIYVGGGEMIAAPGTGGKVKQQRVYNNNKGQTIVGYRRYIK